MSFDLCEGVAVIIDDGIGGGDEIDDIINKIHEMGIPTCEIRDITEAKKFVEHFKSINFIIVDWNMCETHEFVAPPEELKKSMHKQVIDIIKRIREICFAPIFLYTQDSEDDIQDQIIKSLVEADLYWEDQPERNFIHVKNKYELLQEDKLFEDIANWVEANPSLYLLKSWQKEFLDSQNKIFWDLFEKSPSWPKILWESFEREEEFPNYYLSEVIFRLIMADFTLLDLDKDIICKVQKKPNIDELRDVIKKTMYDEGGGQLSGVKPGDIFKYKGKYYMNIRPECDTIKGRDDENNIYLITGEKLSRSAIKGLIGESYTEEKGFFPAVGEAYLCLLDNKEIVKFNFKRLKIVDFEDWEERRKCRLLPPFITRIQQRYTAYLGRFGVPKLPVEIEKHIFRNENGD